MGIATFSRKTASRVTKHTFASPECAAAVGEITPGCEKFGLTNGSWSLIDLISHVLATTGPADLVLSTWTAAGADMGFAYELMRNGAIRSALWVLDFSFPSRQPAYHAALVERFGAEHVRLCKSHAKFVLIQNERWNIAIRSSMNLNLNRRMETWELSDDAGMCQYLRSVVDSLFAREGGKTNIGKKPGELVKDFETFVAEQGGQADEAAAASSTDSHKYFGDGLFANDVRRAGLRTVTGALFGG